jgi:hypothetical protein
LRARLVSSNAVRSRSSPSRYEPGVPRFLPDDDSVASLAQQLDDALRVRRHPALSIGDGICLFGQFSLLLIVEISVRGR